MRVIINVILFELLGIVVVEGFTAMFDVIAYTIKRKRKALLRKRNKDQFNQFVNGWKDTGRD